MFSRVESRAILLVNKGGIPYMVLTSDSFGMLNTKIKALEEKFAQTKGSAASSPGKSKDSFFTDYTEEKQAADSAAVSHATSSSDQSSP